MPDREKVIEALDCLSHGGGTYDCLKFPCPYGFYGYTDCHEWEIARDALALLKEQEAIEPKTEITYNGFHYDYCGNCGRLLPVEQDFEKARFCPYCGRKVKWE